MEALRNTLLKPVQPLQPWIRPVKRPDELPSNLPDPIQLIKEITIFQTQKEAENEIDVLSQQWLGNEVAKVATQPLRRGETPWYQLAGTGFFVKEQVSQLLRNTTSSVEQIAPDVLNRELSKVKVDIEAFEDEYLKQMLSLRWNVSWKEVNGVKKLSCPDYNNVLLESVTDKKEREGAVREALFGDDKKGTEGVEGWLRDAPVGSMAVIVSPDGWSGLKTADGKYIRYPETQVYVTKIEENGELTSFTFRYKASIIENERLQELLGVSVAPSSNQKERIKDMLMRPALITPENANWQESEGKKPIRSFQDVVSCMQEAVNGREIAYEGKTFSEIYSFLENPETFSERHSLTDPLIRRFQEYTSHLFTQDNSSESLEQKLQIALGITILQLHDAYEEKTDITGFDKQITQITSKNRHYDLVSTSVNSEHAGLLRKWQGGMNYQEGKEILMKKPGCAGGGDSTNVSTMGSTRLGEITNSSDYDFDQRGQCVDCGKGPRALGPCGLCMTCDAKYGGKAADMLHLVKKEEQQDGHLEHEEEGKET